MCFSSAVSLSLSDPFLPAFEPTTFLKGADWGVGTALLGTGGVMWGFLLSALPLCVGGAWDGVECDATARATTMGGPALPAIK